MCVYQISYVSSRMCVKTSFLDDNKELQGSIRFFLSTPEWGHEKPGQTWLILFWGRCCAPHIPSHVSPHVFTFIYASIYAPAFTCQRIGPVVLESLWNHVFIRKMYWLILSTRLEDDMFWSWRCTWILTLNSDFSIPLFWGFDSGLNNKNTLERSIFLWSGEEDHVNPCISVVWLSRPTVHGTQPPPCVMTTGVWKKTPMVWGVETQNGKWKQQNTMYPVKERPVPTLHTNVPWGEGRDDIPPCHVSSPFFFDRPESNE